MGFKHRGSWSDSIDRRDFLKKSLVTGAGSLLPALGHSSLAQRSERAYASAVLSFRVPMGLRPTQRHESQAVTPAQAGVQVRKEVDSRFRGNDVTFDGVFMGLRPTQRHESQAVTPAQAGSGSGRNWIPAFAGMT